MKKSYIPLATLLHESKSRLCLAKLLLGHLYDELGLLVKQLRKGTTTLKVGGPLWLAQQWMNTVFENFMVLCKDQVQIKLPIEGFRLAHLEQHFLEKGDSVDHFYNFATKGHIKWWDAYYKQFNKNLKEINEGIQRTSDAIAATENAPQKRKADPSKQTSKRPRGSSKASSAASNPQEDLPQKSVSSSTRLPTIEDSQQDSGVSPKEVSSKSKENYPPKSSANIQIAGQVHQPMNEKNNYPPVIRENSLISSSKGYSPSPEYVRNFPPEKIDALIDQDATTKITSVQVQNVDNSGVRVNDTLRAQNTSNPLNSTTKDDSDLEDLVKVISETKAGSSQGVSLSEAKSVQQGKPTTPISEKVAEIAKMRLESTTNKLLVSAAKKMIQLLSHSIYEIQNNEELTFELSGVSSCLVENQFPQEYKERVKFFNVIFSNLIRTRDRLNIIRNKTANVKENNDNLTTVEETMKENVLDMRST
ncbi:hypothetical protein PIB30_099169 [Stylosanthes scabra]|uniref:Uncharacterized protein n=1 Tax=Stylosanthes scabra TaxID=79078 RepID=A0ABU6UWE8_9FABA|nr:hypothetical protein [Stylosanthes scabra]